MRGWGRVLSTTYTVKGKKKAYVKGYRFQTVSLVWDRVLQKGSLKKMHTSIPVKNKNEFIKIHYIYHTEVKKQIHKLISFSLEHSR